MASIDWNKIERETDEKFAKELASLSKLTTSDIDKLIGETGISKEQLIAILKTITDDTISNEKKAQFISSSIKGIQVLIEIASKIV